MGAFVSDTNPEAVAQQLRGVVPASKRGGP
ncbi:hypothetical protein BH20ACT5_BH20ACT5_20140 [soil metagenome]